MYESDDFYDECDRRGMLVWQDFAFACAAYPEELLAAEVHAEAIDNVGRLQSHPSLVVWCGNNENLMGFADWGWREQLAGRSWGEGFYRTLLPAIVGELDPDRPYIDGSPTSLDPALHPNDDRYGAVHLWDVWNDHDYHHYRSHAPRFVAEFGYQAPATYPTLRHALAGRAARPRRSRPRSSPEGVRGRGQARPVAARPFRLGARRRRLAVPHPAQPGRRRHGRGGPLPRPPRAVLRRDLVATQRLLAGRELGRARQRGPAQAGVVRRPAGVRRPHADRGAGRRRGGADARQRHRRAVGRHARVVALDTDGAPAGEHGGEVHVEANGAIRVALPAACVPDVTTGVDVLVATVGGHRAVHGATEQPSSPPRWEVDVVAAPDGVDVVVTARTTVRDLCCFAERLDPGAVVDDQLVTLVTGESHRFIVRTRDVDVAGWRDAVRSAPSLVLRARGDRPAAPTGPSGPATYHRAR